MSECFSDPKWVHVRRQFLVTLRSFWFKLHGFLKPVEDAHCLNVPIPLLKFLQDRLGLVRGLKDPRFVTLHTNTVNYLQYPRHRLKAQANTIAPIINGPAFPDGLGLIGIPYSQASTLFPNLLICHEIGHFVFEELRYEVLVVPQVDDALARSFGPLFEDLPGSELILCRNLLTNWSEEIFCDRFAIRLIGSAFSFAFIELFDVIGLLNDQLVLEFASHPSDACRFREHLDELSELGWWRQLKMRGADYIATIEALAARPGDDYCLGVPLNGAAPRLVLDAFLGVLPWIKELVGKTCADLPKGEPEAQEEELRLIAKYLSYGVVPSTLTCKGETRFARPVEILNGAYAFYLEDLPTLLQRIAIPEPERNTVTTRSDWSERLETWAMKALGDTAFLRGGEERAIGGFIQKGR